MRFVTSDTHFLDQHLLGVDDFAPRPFADTEQMDEQIIEHWNAKVAENDIVRVSIILCTFENPSLYEMLT
ncbi:hypothetical protein [Limosilactobacillus mucosae]|uniref:hypothetical protein n=1 Tax=Limosilactobacillus mucosae TaxID=97478 RepID=UPI001F047E27|nr:hypothetical protein [Limosilactobacillus mucosae]